jgi:hypothetical protein
MILLNTENFICQHCNAKFTKEKTLMIHMCEQKRRHLAKDERHVVMGLYAFNKFYQLSQKIKEPKSYEEFCHSSYYNAFVKFGSFISNINPLYPEKFVEYVIKSGVKLDHWCREELYEKYILHLIQNESVETALERSIKSMTDWAVKNNSQWNHYFNYVSSNRAMFDIKDGKVSPWIILNCTSGKNMLSQLDDVQLSAISNIIDPQFWVKKFQAEKEDLNLVKQIVKESAL